MNLLNEGLPGLVPPHRDTLPAGRNEAAASGPAAERPATDGPAPAGPAPAGTATEGTAGTGRDRDEQAVARFIERFAGILFESGVPRMPARVFVALLSADADRLSAADLSAMLRVSPAGVSGAVRYLIQVGLVSVAGEPGSRRLSYSVPEDVWPHLLTIRNRTMSRWASVLQDGADLLGRGTPAGERVTDSARYFEFVAAELPRVLARWDEFRAESDQAGDA